MALALMIPMCGAWLRAEGPKATEPDYVRFTENEKGAQLQTAVGRLQNAKGVTVDLIGAVHIADKAYYDLLNTRFKTYDVVLYELVGGDFKDRPKTKQSDAGGRLHWIGWLQETMRSTLALTGQLEGIDYTAGNFVHADMGAGEFFSTQETKGESFLGLFLKTWKAQMAVAADGGAPDQPGLAKVLEILCRKDSPTELKRLVGREFDQVDELMAGVEADGGTVIVGERNRVALEVLDRILAKGRKKIGIFYGAAHLADMEKRLATKGFTRNSTEWLTAWDLPPEPKPVPPAAAVPSSEPPQLEIRKPKANTPPDK